MRPTTPLLSRLKTRIRFSTKQVAKGFYRGSNVGSLGAHTQHGDYLIDWRKTRHYVVPDLRDTQLTPFVSGSILEREKIPVDPSGNVYGRFDGMQYLRWWKDQNPNEYDWFLQREMQAMEQGQEQAETPPQTEVLTQGREHEPQVDQIQTQQQQEQQGQPTR